MVEKSSCLGKIFKYAMAFTMYKTVCGRNCHARPQITAKEDALLAYMAYRTTDMMFHGK